MKTHPCAYCRRRLWPKTRTIEHDVPTCRGGANNGANRLWACARCNTLKGDMTGAEFRHLIATGTFHPDYIAYSLTRARVFKDAAKSAARMQRKYLRHVEALVKRKEIHDDSEAGAEAAPRQAEEREADAAPYPDRRRVYSTGDGGIEPASRTLAAALVEAGARA